MIFVLVLNSKNESRIKNGWIICCLIVNPFSEIASQTVYEPFSIISPFWKLPKREWTKREKRVSSHFTLLNSMTLNIHRNKNLRKKSEKHSYYYCKLVLLLVLFWLVRRQVWPKQCSVLAWIASWYSSSSSSICQR